LVIGAILDTTMVGFWTVGQRLAQVAQQLTKQLNDALFPAVVDSDAAQRQDRLQMILLQGTKLSLGLAVPLCVGLILLAEPLVQSWVGSGFAASVVPAQILLVVVLVRIAGASATTILKGAGEHRLLTLTNAVTAVVNVLLSIVMIRPLGLVGVALGTLIPVATAAALVLYPAACRRVGLPLRKPVTEAFWPAIWPGAFMIAALQLGARVPPAGLLGVALHLVGGGLVYLILFVGVAMRPEERRFYWSKIRSLLDRGRRTPVAA
jgi:O-antigen/teichoic acid export membrane protein